MKEERFVEKNRAAWLRLEEFNRVLAGRGLASLEKERIKEFAGLFRLTGHHLAYANTHFKGSRTALYLNKLVGAAHHYFFVRERTGPRDVWSYIKSTFPGQAKKYRFYFLAAFGTLLLGFFAAMTLVYLYPAGAALFLPAEYLSGGGGFLGSYSVVSAFVMTNNIRVAATAFALGILAGVGTAVILFWNGAVLGALLAYLSLGSGFDALGFWSLILPHGCLELTAIFLSGAAGLLIGRGLLIPGERTRRDSLVIATREAAVLLPGIAAMLVIAGLIEGFFTPLGISPWWKLALAALTIAGMLLYFGAVRLPKRAGKGRKAEGKMRIIA
ncbi:MAG: stage II sporulation protein M [Firmicutes bacterium]|nr:stage II sporulation protein M [Bacillota bacterium]